jgi:tRNA dimethylallyltransferase
MNASAQDPPLIILLAGPTAVGKTDLALELALHLGTEIVNADSMQVYRYMDIGTAKPTPEQCRLVTHHLLDVADPDEPFDAARYAELARPIIEDLQGRGKIPLIVGGTGLYLKVLTRGICPGAPGDPGVREKLLRELETHGLQGLHEELLQVDPEAAGRIHPHDRQRIIRALEVYRVTARPLSLWQSQHRFDQRLYRTVKIFLYRERNVLYERINSRVQQMIEVSLVEEVRGLLQKGYGPELKPMQSLGYRQIAAYLQGRCSREAAISEMERATRRYAKRQLTWFRGDPEFRWFDADHREEILAWIEGESAPKSPLPPFTRGVRSFAST